MVTKITTFSIEATLPSPGIWFWLPCCIWGNEWWHKVTIASDYLNDIDWVCGFSLVGNGYCFSSSSDPGRYFFSSEKNQITFSWRECLTLLKSSAAWYFHLLFMANRYNWPFLIVYEKYVFLHRLPYEKLIHSLDMDRLDLRSLSIIALTSPTNSGLFMEMIWVGLTSCCIVIITIGFIRLFSNHLHISQFDTQILWNFRLTNFLVNNDFYRMLFKNSWLLYSREYLKQIRRMREITKLKWQQFTYHNLYI